MGDKLSKVAVGAVLTVHLQKFAEEVAGVVDDYNAINKAEDVEPAEKARFNDLCMKDVASLVQFLSDMVKETLARGDIPLPTTPAQEETDNSETDAAVINLAAYKANGGLLN